MEQLLPIIIYLVVSIILYFRFRYINNRDKLNVQQQNLLIMAFLWPVVNLIYFYFLARKNKY